MQISNIKLGIGIPLSFPMVPSAFFDSFIAMEKPNFVYLRSSIGAIEAMRNNIIEDALVSECTHVIMMDTDQIYDKKTIPVMLSHKLPVVGCLVYRRYPPFDPLMLSGSVGRYKTIKEWLPDSLVDVDATGCGCLMFEMSVFKKMPRPWFKFRKSSEGEVGEDIGFCSDLKRAGYNIYVDTSIPAGHLSRMVVNEQTWRLYKTLKEAEFKHKSEHGEIVTEEKNNGI